MISLYKIFVIKSFSSLSLVIFCLMPLIVSTIEIIPSNTGYKLTITELYVFDILVCFIFSSVLVIILFILFCISITLLYVLSNKLLY